MLEQFQEIQFLQLVVILMKLLMNTRLKWLLMGLFLYLTMSILMLLLELQWKFHGTMLMILTDVSTLMDQQVLTKLIQLDNFHSHGIYKHAKIFHFHLELTQLKAVGLGSTGIKLAGPLNANKDLDLLHLMIGHLISLVVETHQLILNIHQTLFSQMEILILGLVVVLMLISQLTTLHQSFKMVLIIQILDYLKTRVIHTP